MSLDWDNTKVKDAEELHADAFQWVITQAVALRTMSVGIPRITEANADEFYRRSRIVDLVKGSGMWGPAGLNYHIGLVDIQRRIGLSSNAGSKTPKAFIETIMYGALHSQSKSEPVYVSEDGFQVYGTLASFSIHHPEAEEMGILEEGNDCVQALFTPDDEPSLAIILEEVDRFRQQAKEYIETATGHEG